MLYHTPSRPTTSHGHPAILIDGSPLPPVLARPLPDGTIRLEILLRDYDAGSAYSYSYRHTTLAPHELPQFFLDLAADPEATFAARFGWTPQPAAKRGLTASFAVSAPTPSGVLAASTDLL